MATEFITKSQAVSEIMAATGYGKFVVEKKISELIGAEKIRLIDDPGDNRRKLITREHVLVIIDALTPK